MQPQIVMDGCVQCHMSLPDGRYSFSPALGGHSFNITGDVREAEKLSTSGCISCHKDCSRVSPSGGIAWRSEQGGTGLLQNSSPALYKADGGWQQPTTAAQLSAALVAALYNCKMIVEDRSRGVHNTTYTVQVLMDSIQALDPGFDVSRRPK